MEKASLKFLKLAIFALLISSMVPIFGEGQMVIEEVIMREESKVVNGDEKVTAVTAKVTSCAGLNQVCNHLHSGQPVCCEEYVCSNSYPDGYCGFH